MKTITEDDRQDDIAVLLSGLMHKPGMLQTDPVVRALRPDDLPGYGGAILESLRRLESLGLAPTAKMIRVEAETTANEDIPLRHLVKLERDAEISSVHIRYHAERIAAAARRERTLTIAKRIEARIVRGDDSLAIIEEERQELASLAEVPRLVRQPSAFQSLRLAYPRLRPAVIHNVLRVGETANFIAPPKVGKSWLAYGLALCIVTGRWWLDRYAVEKGAVLICDNELHKELIVSRIETVAEAMGIDPETELGDLFIESVRGELKDINHLAAWLETLEPGRFRLIVLDALYRLLPEGSSENDSADMTAIYNTLDKIGAKLGCAIVCVHHASKGNQSEKGVTDVGSGAGAISRAVDAHIVLRQHQEEKVYVFDGAVRSWAPLQPFCIRWEYPVWTLANMLDPTLLKMSAARAKAAAPAKESALDRTLRKVIEVLTAEGPLTKSIIRTKTGSSGATIKEAVEILVENGAIEPTTISNSRGSFDGFRLAPAPWTTLDSPALSTVDGQGFSPLGEAGSVQCPTSTKVQGDEEEEF